MGSEMCIRDSAERVPIVHAALTKTTKTVRRANHTGISREMSDSTGGKTSQKEGHMANSTYKRETVVVHAAF